MVDDNRANCVQQNGEDENPLPSEPMTLPSGPIKRRRTDSWCHAWQAEDTSGERAIAARLMIPLQKGAPCSAASKAGTDSGTSGTRGAGHRRLMLLEILNARELLIYFRTG